MQNNFVKLSYSAKKNCNFETFCANFFQRQGKICKQIKISSTVLLSILLNELPWIWMFKNLYCSFIRIFHYFWSKLVKDTLVLRAGSEKKHNVWSGKVGQKCSTGQSFMFSEVTSYKIHTLVISLCSALYLPIFWTFSLHVVKYFDDRSPSFWICVLRTQSDSWKRHFFDWVDHCLFHWNCEIIMPSCNQI